ncbi:alcohol dehydrogenase catalytic domain-containing protein [Herbaspirillum lusitanum]|uniref:Alcohol dehydrogenase catalytic domain-containing protein n=1 Tax=Herbaspirillum lusitanum TaxID=213312 RepID=A0ABW9AAW7_9BURK
MRALVFNSGHDVRVEHLPKPIIDEDDDIVVQVSAAGLGGADLHIYRGQIPGIRERDILGREFVGTVAAAGQAVKELKEGDRVVVPSVVACGICFFCQRRQFAACERSNLDRGTLMNEKIIRSGAAFFGYGHFHGGLPGGQAEFVRVPAANVGPVKIPEGMCDDQAIFLCDVLPTAYQAVLNCEIERGDSLAIFGAGPVGQMAAACARMLGVERIYICDRHDHLLRFAAEHYDAIPINFNAVNPEQFIIEHTGFRGADCVIDAVGFEAEGSPLESAMATVKLAGGSGKALRRAIASVRRGGRISVAGSYSGMLHGFMFGSVFEKNVTIKAGRTHVQRYVRELMTYVQEGKLQPEQLVSHHFSLEDGPQAYKLYHNHLEECRKIVLVPGLMQ